VATRSRWITSRNIQAAYLQADTTERRLLNQAFFDRLEIDTEEIDSHTLNAPFQQIRTLIDLAQQAGADTPTGAKNGRTPARTPKDGGSYLNALVDLTGLEPPTS
jgi:hypothetical protein